MEGRGTREDQTICAFPPDDETARLCALIREAAVRRRSLMKARMGVMNNCYAFARRILSVEKEEARALVDRIAKGKIPVDANETVVWYVRTILPALKPIEEQEDAISKDIRKFAAQLPVWKQWGASVRGIGPLNLGNLIGETGDLRMYATHSRLWKRMGVAVLGGTRQGGLPKTASADEWIEHGYSGQRRSVLWNIGECFVKQGDEYKRIYDERKALELERVATKMHAHRRAQRYMEKRFLRDLWLAWNQIARQETATEAA